METIEKKYIEDLEGEDLVVLFEDQDENTWFKHKDTALFYKNMGNYVSIYDVEDEENAIKISEDIPRFIKSHYGDAKRFVDDFKMVEDLIKREIIFVDDSTIQTMSLREIELQLFV